MRVVPKQGYVIYDPDLKDDLPPDGRDVPDSAYWIRRLRDGDVTKVTTTPKQKNTERSKSE